MAYGQYRASVGSICFVLLLMLGQQAAADSPRVVPPLQSRAVSPAELKKLTNFTNTVLLTLYVPTLPRWRNFSQVVEETHFFFANSTLPAHRRVHIVRGDCSSFPLFKRQYGLRAFPTMYLYPAGLTNAAYFRVPFEDYNTTAQVLIDTVHNSVLRTETDLPYLPFTGDVHAAITAMEERDLHISLRRMARVKELQLAAIAAAEAAANASASTNGTAPPELNSTLPPVSSEVEVAATPTAVPLSVTEAEAAAAVATPVLEDVGSPRSLASASATLDVAPDGTVAPDAPLGPGSGPSEAQGSGNATAAGTPLPLDTPLDMSPDAVAAREVQALILDSKAQFEPYVQQASHVVQELRIQLQKAEFYLQVLEAVKLEGSGVIAKWLNPRSHRLIDEHSTLDLAQRETLLLEVGVLNHFVSQRF